MTRIRKAAGKGGIAPALFAAAGLVLAIPSAGLALAGIDAGNGSFSADSYIPFTPATVDPQLARRVAESVKVKGQALRFTPAGSPSSQDRTFTVAVRVDDQTAKAISVRSAIASAQGDVSARTINIAPTRYNLGVARGYQAFAKTPALAKPAVSGANTVSARSVAMPDMSGFDLSEGKVDDKPSRFQPRIALEAEKGATGRSRGTLESLGEQTVDLGGAYRVTRNLDVTAGVRLSQDRDRIAPLTDSVQDSQAVYVGTQFRF